MARGLSRLFMAGEHLSTSCSDGAATKLRSLEEACGVLKIKRTKHSSPAQVEREREQVPELTTAREGDATQKPRDMGGNWQAGCCRGAPWPETGEGVGEGASKSSSKGKGTGKDQGLPPFLPAEGFGG